MLQYIYSLIFKILLIIILDLQAIHLIVLVNIRIVYLIIDPMNQYIFDYLIYTNLIILHGVYFILWLIIIK